MTETTQRRWWFWIGFGVITLLIAGGVSYLAKKKRRRANKGKTKDNKRIL